MEILAVEYSLVLIPSLLASLEQLLRAYLWVFRRITCAIHSSCSHFTDKCSCCSMMG